MPATQRDYLTDYSKIVLDQEGGRGELRAAVPIDPARARVTEVKWLVQGEADVSPAEQAQLAQLFKQELSAALAKLAPRPNGRAVDVRAAITVVKTVSPVGNAITTLLLFVPIDEGGAAVEIEAVDAQNRQQLVALVQGYHAPLSDVAARFRRLTGAEIALKKAAIDFAALVQNPPS